jgi:hypothetical protein
MQVTQASKSAGVEASEIAHLLWQAAPSFILQAA